MSALPLVTRFAPSPTGPLHLGHAYSAMLAHDMARAADGSFLLRMEDIDQERSRAHWEEAILGDLAWLGANWTGPVLRQSERLPAYRTALERLAALGLTYACICSRADIRAAASAPQEGAPLVGPDGLVYPGTCKHADHPAEGAAIRLHMDRALALVGQISFRENGDEPSRKIEIPQRRMIEEIGDVVLARRVMGTSYHLSVVVDDGEQGITRVVRGRDLSEATPIHVLLQRLLGLPTPDYHHHRLIRDEAGKRLAKRDDARAIRTYREAGVTPTEIRRLVGLGPAAP